MKRTGFAKEQIEEVMKRDGITRKSAIRKLRKVNVQALAGTTAPKAKKAGKSKAVKTRPTTAGRARSAGVQLFILAGRPTKEQFIAVYGERGPALTWDQRAALGVDATHFQAALKSGTCVAAAPKLKAMAASAHLKTPRAKKADFVKESDLASVQG